MVGRERELAELSASLLGEEIGSAALFGPAGSGKTRLANEILAAANDAGVRSLRAVASRSAATIPLGALAPLLPASLPEGGELRADVLRQVADAITEEATEGHGRALLLVDDAHLLDAASATVLHQLALLGQVAILMTVRAGEPAPDSVLALWKDGLVPRVNVGNLDAPNVERLLREALGGELDGAATRRLWAASEGNLLLLRELVLGALETEQLVEDEGVWRLLGLPADNPRLTELVDARLGELAADERGLLEVVALGEPLGPSVLEQAGAGGRLTELEARGLVAVDSSGRRQAIRLAHPLYGEVLRTRLPRFRVMEINRALADAVEALGARRREDILRVAVWRLDGGGEVQPDLMLEAARQAHFAFDNALAERLAGAAREAGGGVPAGLLFAEILTTVGRHQECDDVLRSLEKEAGDDFERIQIGTSRSSGLFWGLGRHDEAIEVVRAAERLAPEGEIRDEIIGFHATIDLLAGFPDRAMNSAAQVLESDNPRAVVHAAIAAGNALAVSGENERAVEISRRAGAVHQALGYQQMLAKPWIHEITESTALIEGGHVDEVRSLVTAGYEAALDRHERAAQAWFALSHGRLSLLAGRVATANRWFAEAAAVFRELGHDGQRRWCLAGRALAGAWLGVSNPDLLGELDRLESNPTKMMDVDVFRARAWQAVAAGDPDAGRARLHEATAWARDRGAYSLGLAACHDLIRLGDRDEAVGELLAMAAHVQGPLAAARVRHAEGARKDDGAALTEASEAFESLGAMLLAAEAAADACSAYRRAGDQRRADACEREAARLAERCEGASTPALRGVGPVVPLTSRQRDVALLAAKGLPSKEIAKRLNVSARTVDNHLQQIYRKLGVANRADLADAIGESPT